MSTKHTDLNNIQETPPRDAPSIYTTETVQQGKASPPESFPTPPRRPSRSRRSYWYAIAAVIVILALASSVFALVVSLQGQHPATQVTPTPTTTVTTTPGGDTTPTPTPGVTQGPQNGPASVSDPAYWDQVLGTQGTNGKVESVSFANILGNPTLQALVTVRHSDATHTLDAYVFDKITNAKPVQLFKMQGLVKGDAKISYYNSVMTAEVDRNSTLNAGKSSAQWTQDLFREFSWSDGAGTLVQVAFPGIFPDLTRYQAEADQALVNKGQGTWKNDPAQVAQKFVAQFFDWTRPVTSAVVSGGGPHDVYATVRVQETPVQGAQSQGSNVNVTLSRLEGNTHNLWVVIGAQDSTMLTLTNIPARSLVASPVTFEGTGAAFEAVIGRAVVFDHLYTAIGQAQVTGDNGMGKASYSTKVVYSSSFRSGAQEGIAAVYEANGGISSETYTAVMVKVMLDPEPGVVMGPVACPVSINKPAYWATVIGLDTSKFSVGTLSCANMKGDPSLQIVVPAYHTDGSQVVDVYVYDQITSAHPVQLFSLKGLYRGGALISGYSTLLTAQVDPNSSVNKGKSGDQLTVDLYREFKWSDGAGILVPTAFPGLFPDLTRWQAEMDQHSVAAGQDLWKNNPVQVAQRMVAQFLKWSPLASANLVSGGGPQDVDALVQVKSPNPGGMSINATLSRLEGNTSNMWVVVGVTSGNGLLTITTPVKGDRLSSPATITGTGSAFEGVIGQAFVLDHLYATIGQARVLGASNGKTTYTVTVPYTSSFQGGTQEGIVAVYMYSQADGSIATAAMQKVMLGT